MPAMPPGRRGENSPAALGNRQPPGVDLGSTASAGLCPLTPIADIAERAGREGLGALHLFPPRTHPRRARYKETRDYDRRF
jgi:hypothetical protein